MNYHISPVSKNAKTGEIAVTTSSFGTCPSACPFKKNGCYASNGPLNIHWQKVTRKERGVNWKDFLTMFRSLPKGNIVRLNQAGDLPGVDNKINVKMVRQLISASKDKTVFTYTHKPVLGTSDLEVKNAAIVKEANKNGLTINLSANDLGHVDELVKKKIGPVVVVLDTDTKPREKIFTPAGHSVIVCPATYMDTVTCKTCKLCAWEGREVIIGFPAHGSTKNRINRMLKKKEVEEGEKAVKAVKVVDKE